MAVPSGTSSLVLGDFASPLLAVGNRINQQMIQKYEQDKAKKSQDKVALMKALSFDAVAGLGRKVQEEHLNKLNALRDKWAQRYLANDMKLSDMDYFELQKDQQKTEQEVANMKFDVAQYALAQKEMLDPKAQWKYEPSSLENAANYLKEGRVGEGRAANILVPRIDIGGYLKDNYGAKLNQFREETVDDPKTMTFYDTKTNRESWEQQRSAAEQDPLIQEKIKDPIYKAQFDNFWAGTLSETKGTRPIPTNYYYKTGSSTGTGDSNSPENIKYFKDFSWGVAKREKEYLDRLVGKQLKFGKPDYYRVMPDETVVFLRKKRGTEKADVVIGKLPPVDFTDEDNTRQALTDILDLTPVTMGGKQRPGNIQETVVDPQYQFPEKEKAPVSAYQDVSEMLSDNFSTMGKADHRKNRKLVLDRLYELFPDIPKGKSEESMTAGKTRKITWNGKDYDLATEAGKVKLRGDVDELLGKKGVEATEDIDINQFKRK